MNKAQSIIQMMRPLQWIKSGFVFTGYIFGSLPSGQDLLISIIIIAVAFALISSSVYIFNDIIDLESDRLHPRKRHRPIPSGKVSMPAAILTSLICCIVSLTLGWMISWQVLAILIAYIAINIAYTLYLKHAVIIDVFCIAAGFMLRILAGTFGVNIPPSKWLLLCGLMITLFLGFAKRRAELIAVGVGKGEQRLVLQNYSPVILDQISAICASGVIITYSLYTMNPETAAIHHTENLIYTVPLVIYGLFRYLYLLHHCRSGEDPTNDLLRDPHIIGAVVAWIVITGYLIS